MSDEGGLQMKVFENQSGPHECDPSDEFQNLIPSPKKNWGLIFLRHFFALLVITSVFSVFFIIGRDLFFPRGNIPLENLSLGRRITNDVKGGCANIEEKRKIDCFPESLATEELCNKRGCCWSPYVSQGAPYCYFKSDFHLYNFTVLKNDSKGVEGIGSLINNSQSNLTPDLPLLAFSVSYETQNIVRIKIYDPKNKRYEVPMQYSDFKDAAPKDRNFKVLVEDVGFKVFRIGEQFPLFDSTIGPLIFRDQFLQISSSLPSEYIYGIGEAEDSLKRNIKWGKTVLYAHDSIPMENNNLYGSHPYYTVMENHGKSHGVFLANSNAMEVILQPAPAITFRTIGGILDFRIFLGPSPSEVSDQMTQIVGRPMLPPYWSLGFHLCRFGYKTLNDTKTILQNNLDAGIPIEVQWNDLDYMKKNNDFTVDPVKYGGLSDFIKQLHNDGRRYIPLVDPAISGGETKGSYPPYDEGIEMGIFVKNSTGTGPYIGKVWNSVDSVWPDFSHPNITFYWRNQLERFRKEVPFDGLWIDMNEPSNFLNSGKNDCDPNSNLDYPPYTPSVDSDRLYYKSICPSAQHHAFKHYDVHSLYGTQETQISFKVLGDLTNERPFIISRSTFTGHGKYGGHWTGDVVSNWKHLRKSIPQILNFGLFGIPMVGADICGFNGNTTVALCKAWTQLGAFYPFSRNHNTDDGIPQDPASLGPEVISAAKESLKLRYNLLPYIYSLFFRAHLTGQPVARPLFYEFPSDINAYDIETQFMLGPGILLLPILNENQSKVKGYLPRGWWYQHYDPNIILDSLEDMREIELPLNGTMFPVLYKGGTIIVKQSPKPTTTECRKESFDIDVFLSKENNATGELFWDDGVSNSPEVLTFYNHFTYKAEMNVFRVTIEKYGYDQANNYGQIKIYGVQLATVNSVTVNNVEFNFTFQNKILEVKLNLSVKDAHVIKWI